MLRRIFSTIMSICLLMCFSVTSFAEEENTSNTYDNSNIHIGTVSSSPIARSTVTYDDFDLKNGTIWLTGEYSVNAGTTATLNVWLNSNETNVEMGYYSVETKEYTKISHSTNSDWFKYKYTCTMNIPKSGKYKFYFSNMTAATLTLITPQISF